MKTRKLTCFTRLVRAIELSIERKPILLSHQIKKRLFREENKLNRNLRVRSGKPSQGCQLLVSENEQKQNESTYFIYRLLLATARYDLIRKNNTFWQFCYKLMMRRTIDLYMKY